MTSWKTHEIVRLWIWYNWELQHQKSDNSLIGWMRFYLVNKKEGVEELSTKQNFYSFYNETGALYGHDYVSDGILW